MPEPTANQSQNQNQNQEEAESAPRGPTCIECGHTARDLDTFHEHLEYVHDAYTETTRRFLRDPQAYYG